MNEVFQLIAEVGFPIAGALVMGAFIFIIIKQLMAGVVGQVETLTKFCESLENHREPLGGIHRESIREIIASPIFPYLLPLKKPLKKDRTP